MISEKYPLKDPFVLYSLYKSGDEHAFEVLYHHYSGIIYNYLLKLVGNRDLAEDILAETFIKLLNSNLTKKGTLKNWLYRVATNAAYKTFRTTRKDLFLDRNVEKMVSNPSGHDYERTVTVQKALLKIPEIHRSVVILKYYQGFKYREIAEILGCPEGTVKTRMQKGLQLLKKLLKKDFHHKGEK
jgi:RNA polymerase sigma-70 factor (ECF subfamily)